MSNYNIILPGTLGDLIISTPAVNQFIKNNNVCIYSTMNYNNIIFNLLNDKNVTILDDNNISEEILNASNTIKLDPLQALFESGKINKHMVYGFAKLLNVEIENPHYIYNMEEKYINKAKQFLSKYNKPIIICSPYSICCCKYNINLNRGVKMMNWDFWIEFEKIANEKYDLIFVSAKNEIPYLDIQSTWLYGENIHFIAALLKLSDLCITVCNGISHLAAAVDANIVKILGATPEFLYTGSIITKGKYISFNTFPNKIEFLNIKPEVVFEQAENLING